MESALTPTPSRGIARSFAALASGDAVGRVLAFLAGVYVARELGAALFGVMAFGQAVVLYFTHLSACGLELTGAREIAADPTRTRTLLPSILCARTLISAALAALLCCAALAWLPPLDAAVVGLYSLTLFGQGPNPKFALVGLARPAPVALARTAGEAAYALLVLALVRTGDDLVFVPWAQALGDVLAALLMLLALRRLGHRVPLELDWPAVRPLFARSFPLVLNILLGLLIFNSDLLVLRAFRDATTVGWYSASYQLISFLINLAGAYSLSLMPALTRASEARGERRALYLDSLAQSVCIGLPIAVGGALCASELIELVFGAAYESSSAPLAVLVASIPLMAYKDVTMVAMVVAGREKAVLRITFAAVLFNLAANLLVIPRWGMVGAASTTLATEALRMGLGAWYVRRLGLPLLAPARVWRTALATCAMALAVALIPLPTPRIFLPGLSLAIPSVLVTVALGALAYALALAATGGLRLRRGALPTLEV
ncbi:MAG: flippase [Planctomycetes bacterium]|nr:flippase [Planctomycetota bacterium]